MRNWESQMKMIDITVNINEELRIPVEMIMIDITVIINEELGIPDKMIDIIDITNEEHWET